mgnify:CR=1 FL=1
MSEQDSSRQSVVDRPISDEMRDSYMQYAMSVIKSRALPDVRDGLKPSQRRVLYTMSHDLSLTPNRQRVKSARVVGDAMGRYHPHGDSAIYGTLVRMAQDFSSRYVLVDKKGNFGSIADPTPAAMRYTECRMAPAAVDMVADLDLGTVDLVDNYDGTLQEPLVLPSRFPNLICNGSQGIAVGMATSIPPHNLVEVATALVALVRDPQLPDEKLQKIIPGPDFPTGGIICGVQGVRDAYRTGRGQITVRGKVDIEQKGDKATITVTELPYQVTTEMLKEKIHDAVSAGRIEGLSRIADRSKETVNFFLECKKGEDPQVILNQLYKFTPLQETFSIIMIALDEKGTKPRTYSLRELLRAFIDHRFDVIRRRTAFLLRRCQERIHVLEGLQAAVDKIDAVIALIRGASTPEEARDGLRELLETPGPDGKLRPLSLKQANEILQMRLQRLTGLERDKLAGELKEQRTTEADLRDILMRHERVVELFIKETEALKQDYPDKRRTEIQLGEATSIDIEDLIADESTIVTVTHLGYIKRTALDQYRVQSRAGKGLYGASAKDDDFVTQMFEASTKAMVLIFTSHGRVHWVKVHQIPEGSRTARGRGIKNLIALLPDETVESLIPIKGEFGEDRYLVMATAKGVIKKTTLSAFARPKKGGIVAVKLDEGDKLIGVRITDGQRELVLATRHGKAIRFSEETVRAMGRVSRGVRGMSLESDDVVVSLQSVGEDGPQLLTVCELGYGKRTVIEDYRETNRGGKGIRNIKTTARNGLVAGVLSVREEDQVVLISDGGKLIRMRVSDISCIGRDTQGVRLIKVETDEKVVAVARVETAGEDPEVAAAAVQKPAETVAVDAGEASEPEPEEDEAPADEAEEGDEGGDEE